MGARKLVGEEPNASRGLNDGRGTPSRLTTGAKVWEAAPKAGELDREATGMCPWRGGNGLEAEVGVPERGANDGSETPSGPLRGGS